MSASTVVVLYIAKESTPVVQQKNYTALINIRLKLKMENYGGIAQKIAMKKETVATSNSSQKI